MPPTIQSTPSPNITTYAVLDFETTGLNPKHGDRAIELGISLYRNGNEIDTFSSLINPGMRIDPFITSLTGITNSMVATAPPAGKVMQNALDFVGDAHLVAHRRRRSIRQKLRSRYISRCSRLRCKWRSSSMEKWRRRRILEFERRVTAREKEDENEK